MNESTLNSYELGRIEIESNIYSNVRIDNLSIIGELGSGNFGTVTERMLENNILAVKRIQRMDRQKERTTEYMDLKVMKNANSPFIVKYYGCIVNFDSVYICMEVMSMSLKDLKKYLQPQKLIIKDYKIPELILGNITVAVVEALKYLEEELKLIHRDIKPQNILIHKNGTVKLCDFGISAYLNDPKAMSSFDGCYPYLSPEKYERQKYDCRSDIWSLGITIFELATFEHPYKFKNGFELSVLIIEKNPQELPNDFSSEFRDFTDHCLINDPARRPTYQNLTNHPWFQLHRIFDANVVKVWLSEVLSNTVV